MPAPTVAEVLKSAGMDDTAIAALDAKVIAGFTGVMTTAAAEREAAELAQRATSQMFDNEITPALNAWGTKEANLEAERDYYKTLAGKAKDGGFIAEVPPFKAGEVQPRNTGGQFVPNAVPGSPNFAELESKVGSALGTLSDLQWTYQTLHGGKVMPDSPTALAAEAAAQKMGILDYAAKKYDFAGKKATIEREATEASHKKIRDDAIADRDKYWAERAGSNPNVRPAQASAFAELKKGVTDGTRVDPLKMSREQRHAATAAGIRKDMAEQVQ
jgi:hypothetical protein